ncbi:Spy/CpxP family protein refolding chaperone [Sinorhizobium meliloti]|uniref:Spy/CpxP family protein refolding chaperone n=2 Tax=Rhizobium meliloti TaxID=382 RepID=UPI002285AEAD|nr:Spy/CpxP family protein refolding chaperone [Sinorhizobium meliloti]MDW9550039.1 hypothetical protein [Sinorhizobium meliloti]
MEFQGSLEHSTPVDLGERALVSRLESVRKLKASLVPLYQSFEGAQKQTADKLLERDAFRRNRKGDSFFCANQIHHSGR